MNGNDFYKWLLEAFWKEADKLFPVLNKLYNNQNISYEEYGRILRWRRSHQRRSDEKKTDKEYFLSLYQSGKWDAPVVISYSDYLPIEALAM